MNLDSSSVTKKLMRSFTFICLGILFLSCNRTASPIALWQTKDCFISSLDKKYDISEIVVYSDEIEINKKKLSVPAVERIKNQVSICELLKAQKLDIKSVQAIVVMLKDKEKESIPVLINSSNMELIGKDTSILLFLPIQ